MLFLLMNPRGITESISVSSIKKEELYIISHNILLFIYNDDII